MNHSVILSKSLEMAVEAAFELSIEQQVAIENDVKVRAVSKAALDQLLSENNHFHGLKSNLRDAFCSGDEEMIAAEMKTARQQAQFGYRNKLVRALVTDMVKCSRRKGVLR